MINKVATSKFLRESNFYCTVIKILVTLTMEINYTQGTTKAYQFSSSSSIYIVHCKNTQQVALLGLCLNFKTRKSSGNKHW